MRFHSLVFLKDGTFASFLHLALVNEVQANINSILKNAYLFFPFSN